MSIKRGFTFIEFLLVISIIAVLGAFFLSSFSSGQRKARDTQRRSDLKQYQTSLEQYANRSSNLYPTSSTTMAAHCGILRLASCPDDPKGVLYQYVAEVSGLGYYIWAQLEQPNSDGDTEYYVVCSNGVTGVSLTPPSSAACPI